MTRPRFLSLVLIAMCCTGWLACKQERQPCLSAKTATLNAQTLHFNADTSKTTVDTLLPSAVFVALTIDSLKGIAFPKSTASFPISLSPDSVYCQWAFSTDTGLYRAGIKDTLSFYYRRTLQFLSNSCGYTYFYSLDSVLTTHTIIDSVRIINTSVTNDVKPKHLQIYIHPGF